MIFVPEKFTHNKLNYFCQPLLASLFVVLTLIVLGGLKHVNLLGYIGTGSLGASAFLAFCLPKMPRLSRRLIGGYLISIVCGVMFSSLCRLSFFHAIPYCIDGAAVVAMTATIFAMVFLRLEHPPAVGFVLGLMIDTWDIYTLFMIFSIVLLMVVIKSILQPWLINLS